MSRMLPHPRLSATLFLAWLALASSLAPIDLAGAAVLAIVLPLAAGRLIDERVPIARPGTAIRLALVVLWDIVRANVVMVRLVLGPTARLRPAFVVVPLDAPHPQAVALLASIVTMTPGTVTAEIDDARTSMLVHVLHTDDPARVVADIKSRYERPLKEIFGC
jgi:multicomponent K+:H+ antiporter subunit E